jgi:hypothetical protein
MSYPTTAHSAVRTLLIAALLQGIAVACDLTSPVNSDGKVVPDPSFTAVPSGLTASATSWSQIDLSWPRSPSADGYQVFRSANGATGSYSQVGSTPANVTSYSDQGLTGSTQYCYRLRSTKTAGRNTNLSGYSDPVCATTPAPPPIAAPSATDVVPQGSWAVQVRWTDNSPDEEGFFIERYFPASSQWISVNTAPANATSQIQSVNQEEETCFRVVAFIGARRSPPSASDCTAAPAVPMGLSAKATVDHTINLHWTDNSLVEDGYEVSRYYYGGDWAVIATLPAGTESYLDNSLTVDVRYIYQVRALRDGGYGNTSAPASALAPTAKPAAPTEAQTWFDYDYWSWEYTFYIAWQVGSSNEDGFRIEISDGAGGWTTYATTDAGAWSYQEPFYGQAGCYRVIAFNVFGDSSASNEACVSP